jgi:hypothetical protein
LHWWLLPTKRLHCLIYNSGLFLSRHQPLKPRHFFLAVLINLHGKANCDSIVMVHSSKLLQLRTRHPLKHWLKFCNVRQHTDTLPDF